MIGTNKASCLAADFMHSFEKRLFRAPLSCLAILQEHSLAQLTVTQIPRWVRINGTFHFCMLKSPYE